MVSAQAQVPSYSEDFSTGYQQGVQLDTQNGWNSNDTYTGGAYTYNNGTQTGDIGSSDFVGGPIANFSASQTDYVGYLGGLSGVAPGVGASGTPVSLTHALPLPGTTNAVFSSDFLITASAFGTAHDNFSINLTGAGGVRQIGINFVIPGNSNLNADNVTYSTSLSTLGNPQSAAITSIPLGTQRYKLTLNVNVTANTFGATLTQETSTGGLTGNVLQLVANGTSYGVIGSGGITGFGIGWTLADQTAQVASNVGAGSGTNNIAHPNAGTNGIYFDNIVVTVPEPSTYALLGLGAICLALAIRRSRLTRTA